MVGVWRFEESGASSRFKNWGIRILIDVIDWSRDGHLRSKLMIRIRDWYPSLNWDNVWKLMLKLKFGTDVVDLRSYWVMLLIYDVIELLRLSCYLGEQYCWCRE